MMTSSVPPIVIMGVQGSGKTTVGELLARRLGVPFLDADSLHSTKDKEWMASGHALSDQQRLPWLREVGERLGLGADAGIVVACSALKRSYRDLLREQAPAMLTVLVSGDPDVIRTRLAAREHAYMPASLLPSQLADLEPPQEDERGLAVDLATSPGQIVERVVALIAEEVADQGEQTT